MANMRIFMQSNSKDSIHKYMLSIHINRQIYNFFLYQPTTEQKKIINSLSLFVAGETDSNIFVLNGYAGTGKTTIISALAKCLKSLNINHFLLAPTGRAAKVVASYSDKSATTIHKKIFRQKSQLENRFELAHNKSRDTIYIIDEASMIANSSYDSAMFGSGRLLDDIFKYVENGINCKLIFVGDSAQLPPIGTLLSPALDRSEISFYGDTTFLEMSQVVRQQSESGILHNATIVREMINRGDESIPKFKLGFEDFERIGSGDLLEIIEDNYAKYGKDDTLVIVRSNKQANRFNQGIRARVLYQEEQIDSGDYLMIVKNNYFYDLSTIDPTLVENEPEQENFLANGDVARIRRVRRYNEIHGFRFADVTLELPDMDDLELDCKIILDTLESESPSLSAQQQSKLFESVEQDYLHITKKADRYKAMRQDPFLNALQVKFAYAVTCHKAQGGQWSAVVIDRFLWGDQTMTLELLRWLYTALTRASKKVYLLNFEDSFFEE